MPKKKHESRPKRQATPIPLYRQKPPKSGRSGRPQGLHAASTSESFEDRAPEKDLPHAHVLDPSHFVLRDDGAIRIEPSSTLHPPSSAPQLVLSSDHPFLRLYRGNCLELLDAIAAKYGDAGRFDAIFADPPYFLSNGGITCHAGRMVKVDKGDWDKSQGRSLIARGRVVF